MNKLTKKEKKLAIARAFIVLIGIAVMVAVIIYMLPFINKILNEDTRMEFKEDIANMGFKGVLIVLLLQILQIVLSIIPGQPMEIVSGMLYGTWGGMLLCLVGIFLGTAIVYFSVRKIGTDLIQLFFSKEKIDAIKNTKTFKNPRNLEILMFIMFVIPLIPKDIFIYLGGLSPIKPKRFLFVATFTRIPGLFLTVFAGNQLSEGSFLITLILVIVFLVIGGVGYYISDKAKKQIEKES